MILPIYLATNVLPVILHKYLVATLPVILPSLAKSALKVILITYLATNDLPVITSALPVILIIYPIMSMILVPLNDNLAKPMNNYKKRKTSHTQLINYLQKNFKTIQIQIFYQLYNYLQNQILFTYSHYLINCLQTHIIYIYLFIHSIIYVHSTFIKL